MSKNHKAGRTGAQTSPDRKQLGGLRVPLGIVLIFGLLLATTVGASGGQALAAEGPDTQAEPPSEVLDSPSNGSEAVEELGEELPEVAAVNDLTPEELTELLEEDDTAWLDTDGRLHYIDVPPERGAEAPTAQEAPYPLDQTFKLNSRPKASRVIFLDFDGHKVSGTWWNQNYGVSTSTQPRFDLDGNPSTFNTAERTVIQSVWQRVAEDYAPFNVNVTTQDPGIDAIRRSSSSDSKYGTRALITPSTQAANAICGGGCGGVAYVGVFNEVDPWHSQAQPAWVFSHLLSNNAKYIAEAVSHEVGHNLALHHHGKSSSSYYEGHGAWAPIMGIGYYRPITQWSRGEYTGATNSGQDDLKVMQAYGAPLRKDDHGNKRSTATLLGSSGTDARLKKSGVISTRADRDVFAFDQRCSGNASFKVKPAPTSPNADLRLRLYDASGTRLKSKNPTAAMIDEDRASGLGAKFTMPLKKGRYYVRVEGVGAGTVNTGYSDYASLGAYRLRIDRCVP